MAEKYDSNGDYSGYQDDYQSDFKRKNIGNPNEAGEERRKEGGGGNEENQASQKVVEYVRELLAEKILLDENKHRNATRLIEQGISTFTEIAKVQNTGKVPLRDYKYVDIYREKPIKVTVKVLVPIREHPRFNFVGKLLGPKGNSMKRLQEETMCKMAILGRGSMKDRQREEELRQSLDPKYSHLTDELHVEISALGPPAEAHARIAFALAEIRKYLIPDSNDNIRQEQLRELERISGGSLNKEHTIPPKRPAPPREGEMRPVEMQEIAPSKESPMLSNEPVLDRERSEMRPGPMRDMDAMSAGEPSKESPLPPKRPALTREMPPRPPPLMRTATRTPLNARSVMPAKTKIMSILDRARVAMEESYGMSEEPYEPNEPAYGGGPYSQSRSGGYSHHYEPSDYDVDYYGRGEGGYGAPPPRQINSFGKGEKSILNLLKNSRRY